MNPFETRQGGVVLTDSGADFAVGSHHAERIELCLFDASGRAEVARLPMERDCDHVHRLHVDGIVQGARYGFRAHGRYAPDHGYWFDPSKLLVDPYATEIDRPFAHDPRLSVFGSDTAALVPKTIVTNHPLAKPMRPLLPKGGFIYELAVKTFTMRHPEVPPEQRGTVAALAHPAIIAHLKKLGVNAIELMPIVAWIDERHLPPIGLTNLWGYNPIALMALDPRIVPGGMRELRETVQTLHDAGIGVLLDLVFNHTGESDKLGTTLSLRGLDNLSCYRHLSDNPGVLVNDTGCGNTLACDHPYVRHLIIDSLRHFVIHAGVDGFRFDLAPILGRTTQGFHTTSRTLHAILVDEVLEDRVMIAEPWDIGPGGYQLGNFPAPFLEWNDRARDDIRRYWRGDSHMAGNLATALAGSSEIFTRHKENETRSVNFVAAHDGFTLFDLVSHSHKRNGRNGEHNRDGHDENYSWNNGVEGQPDNVTVLADRHRDVTALLATLFATRGTIMLTAGDEFGRTQHGNNNAYCQDNELTWLDWEAADQALIAHVSRLSQLRKRFSVFGETHFFANGGEVEWLSPGGTPMSVSDWEDGEALGLAMVLQTIDYELKTKLRLAVLFNRSHVELDFRLPQVKNRHWHHLPDEQHVEKVRLGGRSVAFYIEQ
ncbi:MULTISPECIES: glycogen debranching protein GlgX [Alphaproteobacteria]|uniref:Glycogen operon protein GlgX homolog n=2 Tax=Alphaproteobacteria TaxID=28211 RepID=A0A512HKR6_9HYPH|nr:MULTISPECIES: glycogen debranching protein GlgX [Alphaproteobacteria]GEO86035.1 glycogen operon protein GlgX homolog [Ciceribacter naphthalenivorans]GLR22122.1 glycogen operon protein GlgX homolog [Ciceribacter naphthalenivorans]GLT04978.1 glycogen operon protein GlgX homolog [Sphingomonas psychrolutea]